MLAFCKLALLAIICMTLLVNLASAEDCKPGFQCFMPSDGMGFNDDPGRPRIPVTYAKKPKKDRESSQTRIAKLNKQRMGELGGGKRK
jgi:hypothetical protein